MIRPATVALALVSLALAGAAVRRARAGARNRAELRQRARTFRALRRYEAANRHGYARHFPDLPVSGWMGP